MDTFDRARRDTQIAARAFLRNDGMHLFGSTQDGIDRASLDAQCTADTHVLIDGDDGFKLLFCTILGGSVA